MLQLQCCDYGLKYEVTLITGNQGELMRTSPQIDYRGRPTNSHFFKSYSAIHPDKCSRDYESDFKSFQNAEYGGS